MKPSHRHENKLRREGYIFIAGLDEVGRGSWAGPLVAAAVILHPEKKLKGIQDSKLLSPKQREKLFLYITKNCAAWSVGIVSHQEIDNQGIIPANRLAFERAVKRLPVRPDYLLVDGLRNFESPLRHEFVVKGDQKIVSVAAASIIAKVARDKILENLHKTYPEYEFQQHKGYGTKKHIDAIKKNGVSEIHRMSYRPMAAYA